MTDNMDWTPLITKLMITCCSWTRSARTMGTPLELVVAHLNLDQQMMKALRKVKAPVVPA